MGGSPPLTLSAGSATSAEPAFPSYASSSAAAPPPSRLLCLIPLTPPSAIPRPAPRAKAAALGRVASPPRGVGPALPGRRIALASAVSLSSSARLPPPPAPRRARGGMAPLVVSHVGPAAAATGLPLAGSYLPTPLAEAETAQLSPPPTVDSRSHPGPSGLGLPIRRLAHCLPTAPPPPRSPPSGAPASGGAAAGSPGSMWVRMVSAPLPPPPPPLPAWPSLAVNTNW